MANQEKKISNTIIAWMEKHKVHYQKYDDALTFHFGVDMDNQMLIDIYLKIDEKRGLVYLLADPCIPFQDNYTFDGIVAINNINCALVSGCFYFDMEMSRLLYRNAHYYMELVFSEISLNYLIYSSLTTISDYHKDLTDLANGHITIREFLEKETN